MLGLLEISIALIFLAVLCALVSVRQWISTIGPSNRRIILVFIALLMVGQVLNESRKLFPFVRWSMYTEISNENLTFNGKFQACHADGTTCWINPTACYPSLSRNNHERVLLIMEKIRNKELSERTTNVFDQYMLALAQRYSRTMSANPVVEIRAIIEEVQFVSGQRQAEQIVVKTLPFEFKVSSDPQIKSTGSG